MITGVHARTCARTNEHTHAPFFARQGYPVLEIHSRKSQGHRNKVSEHFRNGRGLVMFTSDVSARGMDYPDVTAVMQVSGRARKEGAQRTPPFFMLPSPSLELRSRFFAWNPCGVCYSSLIPLSLPYLFLLSLLVSLCWKGWSAERQGAVHPPPGAYRARGQGRARHLAPVRL